jgi:hypothetical protein
MVMLEEEPALRNPIRDILAGCCAPAIWTEAKSRSVRSQMSFLSMAMDMPQNDAYENRNSGTREVGVP